MWNKNHHSEQLVSIAVVRYVFSCLSIFFGAILRDFFLSYVSFAGYFGSLNSAVASVHIVRGSQGPLEALVFVEDHCARPLTAGSTTEPTES